jgi:hypothetical protein
VASRLFGRLIQLGPDALNGPLGYVRLSVSSDPMSRLRAMELPVDPASV